MNEPISKQRTALDSLARAIRVVTVPPLMVAVILALLFFTREELFRSPSELLYSTLFLALIPGLAYPLSYMIPKIRAKGRAGQRSLAMYLSAVGYLGVVIYGIAASCTEGLRVIHLTYLLSVILLLILNKVIHLRASGHACSVSGPILLLCIYIGAAGAVTGILLWAVILWASIRMRHHTMREYLIGSAVPILAYVISAMLYALI